MLLHVTDVIIRLGHEASLVARSLRNPRQVGVDRVMEPPVTVEPV
jgi:hypothetical protein